MTLPLQKLKAAINLFLPGAVPVDSKAAELKFWTKSDGQVSYQESCVTNALDVTQPISVYWRSVS